MKADSEPPDVGIELIDSSDFSTQKAIVREISELSLQKMGTAKRVGVTISPMVLHRRNTYFTFLSACFIV